MIDPKEKGDGQTTAEVVADSAGPSVAIGSVVTDGMLLRIIAQWDVMRFYVHAKNKGEVDNLFDVQTGTETAMLVDQLVFGDKKLIEADCRKFKFIMAMQVTHARQGGVLRVWKPAMYRPGPGAQKFFSEYAARHGCKAVHYHSAPLRSTI